MKYTLRGLAGKQSPFELLPMIDWWLTFSFCSQLACLAQSSSSSSSSFCSSLSLKLRVSLVKNCEWTSSRANFWLDQRRVAYALRKLTNGVAFSECHLFARTVLKRCVTITTPARDKNNKKLTLSRQKYAAIGRLTGFFSVGRCCCFARHVGVRLLRNCRFFAAAPRDHWPSRTTSVSALWVTFFWTFLLGLLTWKEEVSVETEKERLGCGHSTK